MVLYLQVLALIVFQLSLIDKKFNDVLPLLNQAGHLVDNWQGNQFQKEYLRVFFLVLQVYFIFYLMILSYLASVINASQLCVFLLLFQCELFIF